MNILRGISPLQRDNWRRPVFRRRLNLSLTLALIVGGLTITRMAAANPSTIRGSLRARG